MESVPRQGEEDRLASPVDELPKPPKLPGGKRHDEVFNPRKLFVGGLSRDTTQQQFRDYWEQYGELEDCIVMIDQISQKGRGFGFVVFASQDIASDVLSKGDSFTMHGRKLDIKKAVPRSQRGGEGFSDRPSYSSQGASYDRERRDDYHSAAPYPSEQRGRARSPYRDSPASRDRDSYDRGDRRRRNSRKRDKLFVGGLAETFTDNTLNSYFAKYGKVHDAIVMSDKEGRSRRFGFITFVYSDDVEAVLKDGKHCINGVNVTIERAIPREHMSSSATSNLRRERDRDRDRGRDRRDSRDRDRSRGRVRDRTRDRDRHHRDYEYPRYAPPQPPNAYADPYYAHPPTAYREYRDYRHAPSMYSPPSPSYHPHAHHMAAHHHHQHPHPQHMAPGMYPPPPPPHPINSEAMYYPMTGAPPPPPDGRYQYQYAPPGGVAPSANPSLPKSDVKLNGIKQDDMHRNKDRDDATGHLTVHSERRHVVPNAVPAPMHSASHYGGYSRAPTYSGTSSAYGGQRGGVRSSRSYQPY